jgi:hypothetical protein
MLINPLIFFFYPGPMGREENQLTPLWNRVNVLIFNRFGILFNTCQKSTYINCNNLQEVN